MAQITLYCGETPSLKLGPGATGDTGRSVAGNVIVFAHGFSTFEEEDFPDWQTWVDAPGTPTIRVVDVAAGEATDAGGVECDICGLTLTDDEALDEHLAGHAPAPVPTEPAPVGPDDVDGKDE